MPYDVYRSNKRSDLEFYVPVGSPLNLPYEMNFQYAPFHFVRRQQSIPWLLSDADRAIEHNISVSGYHVAPAQLTATANSTATAAIGGGLLGASMGGFPGAVIGAIAGVVLAESAKNKEKK